MGGRGRGGGNKRNRTQRRDFRDGRPNEWKRSRPASEAGSHANSEAGWNPFVMESPAFESFYKKQKIVPEDEWDAFIATLRKPLPTTFRINGSGQFAHEIRDQMLRDFFDQLKNGAEVDGEVIEPVRALPWYPDNLAWHLNYSRMQIRKLPILERIHEFLKLENEIGSITRQEAVSMIPPLFLDVQPHHKVLDRISHMYVKGLQLSLVPWTNMIECQVCAAPGSKTFQLLENIHRDVKPGELSDGMVIANDSDVQRCHLLIHQTKRMCSPNIMVTNHDAQLFPGLKDKSGHVETALTENTFSDIEVSEEESNGLYFDRILCDVPCSGDGTLRKAPDIWRKWNSGVANGLHRLQVQIAMRGVALLKTGGRLVYSTCSLNPVEDEAVVGEILRESRGSVELLDVTSELPELKRRPGLTSWLIRDRKRWLSSASNINRHKAGAVVPSMFPSGNGWDLSDLITPTEGSTPPADVDEDVDKKDAEEADDDQGPPEVATLPLERCMRLLPHDQDTGGFFIAVFCKVAPFKAIPKVKEGQHKPRVSHKRSDKETVIADSEVLLVSAPVETNAPDMRNSRVGDGSLAENRDSRETEDLIFEIREEEVSAVEEECVRGEGGPITTDAVIEEEEKTSEATLFNTNQLPTGRIQRQGRWKGVDPVLFLKDQKIIESLVDFYGIKDTFPLHQHLVVRSEDTTRSKRIYYVSGSVANAIQLNFRAGEQMKITSAGLKIFERQQLKEGASTCMFRIASEGLPVLLPHMTKQIVVAPRKDFRLLLANKVVPFSTFNDSTFTASLQDLKHGCCVVALPTEGPDAATNIGATDTAVACWRGRTNVSVLITKAEANQMHQRLSFSDDAVNGAIELESREAVSSEPIGGASQGVTMSLNAEREAELGGVSAEVSVVENMIPDLSNGSALADSNQAATIVAPQAPENLLGESVGGFIEGTVELPPADPQ